ncbi:phosphotransferase [Brooklawnia cerclae]|uniref:Ser/Thr protein kinase RdoA (MazF antagonist) n=1 Tax=Brooklawnia cerclae TaxID=349934 RepID=A0ABX0SEA8_9ACTN|nr:phosphotransferase [Brooklawnia cerclae]NIH56733.1 Ser/Thr protein kinase RdoA (MazF antagonist) [Brooklawnia cerclae]
MSALDDGGEAEGLGHDPQLDVVAPVWPRLTVVEADRVLGMLASPQRATRIVFHSNRPTAAAALVETPSGRVFVKRYAPASIEVGQLEATHGFVDHLVSHGFPTPPFLRFADGTTAFRTAQGLYEVSAAAHGEDRYRQAHSWTPPRRPDEARSFGAACARLALASEGFDAPAPAPSAFQSRCGLFMADPIDRLTQWLDERPAVRAYLSETGKDLATDARMHADYSSRLGRWIPELGANWTHGDLHVSNAMWEGDEVREVIDFGLADRAFALYDLAVAIERNGICWLDIMNGHHDAYRTDVIDALIAGYEGVRPLHEAERAALPDLMAVVQSEAALNWITYQYGVLHDLDSCEWSYRVFFQAHTAWFGTRAGRGFTAWLRGRLGR